MKLVNAKLYEEQIKRKMWEIWYDEKYQYYFGGNWRSDLSLADNNSDYPKRAFAVLNNRDELIGYISYSVDNIQQMGDWKPKYVIWENVKNVLTRYNRHNFDRYISELERLGYTSNYAVLDARDFGLPQARERVFTISTLNEGVFDFDSLIHTPMQDIRSFLLDNAEVPSVYDVTQPSVLSVIGETGIRRATIIRDYAFTVTTRQDRTPAQVVDCGNGRYRYLTELECWRLQGYTDEDYRRAEQAQKRVGRYYTALYKQAGNSIAVPIFESIFRKMLLGETA